MTRCKTTPRGNVWVGVAKAAATGYQTGGPFLGKLKVAAQVRYLDKRSDHINLQSSFLDMARLPILVRGMLSLLKEMHCLTQSSGRS